MPDLGFSMDGMATHVDIPLEESGPMPDQSVPAQNATAAYGPPRLLPSAWQQTMLQPAIFPEPLRPEMAVDFDALQHGNPFCLDDPSQVHPPPAMGTLLDDLYQLPGFATDNSSGSGHTRQSMRAAPFQAQDTRLDLVSSRLGRHGLIGTRVLPPVLGHHATCPQAPPGFQDRSGPVAGPADQDFQGWAQQWKQPQAQQSEELGLLDAGSQVDVPAAVSRREAEEALQPMSDLLWHQLGLADQVGPSLHVHDCSD